MDSNLERWTAELKNCRICHGSGLYHGAPCGNCNGDGYYFVARFQILDDDGENKSMIPDEISGEHDGDMPIRVDIMPSLVFEELWSGLASTEQLLGPSVAIEATRIWLNYTMQGREEGDDDGQEF